MNTQPRIIIESLSIEALDMRPAQNAIRAKFGPRYHVNPECLKEIAALWWIEPPNNCINDRGVFVACTRIDHRAGRCSAEVRYARAPSGLWAMDTSYMTATCGAASAPSVWNRLAFLCEADARTAGLRELIQRFRGIAECGGSAALDARKLTQHLEAEQTPQLSLF